MTLKKITGSNKELNAYSLFSGGGGFHIGMKKAGYALYNTNTWEKNWDPFSQSLIFTALLSHTSQICKKQWYSGKSAVHWIKTS